MLSGYGEECGAVLAARPGVDKVFLSLAGMLESFTRFTQLNVKLSQ